MTFRYGGTTSVTPGPSIPGTIIVGWTPAIKMPPAPGQTATNTAGRAYPDWTPTSGDALRMTAAGIRLNADFIEGRDQEYLLFWTSTNWTRGAWGPIFLHELAHVLGLGHVEDPNEIMNPEGASAVAYGPGDLAGLHQLGAAAGCL